MLLRRGSRMVEHLLLLPDGYRGWHCLLTQLQRREFVPNAALPARGTREYPWKGPTGSSGPTPMAASIPSPCKGSASLWRGKDAALSTLRPRGSSFLNSFLPSIASSPWSSHSYMSQIPGKASCCKARWLWHQLHQLRITEHPHLGVLHRA